MPWKIQFTFEQGKNGWTETFYSDRSETDRTNVVSDAFEAAVLRAAILAQNAFISYIRYSHTSYIGDGYLITTWIKGTWSNPAVPGSGGGDIPGTAINAGFYTDTGKNRNMPLRGIPDALWTGNPNPAQLPTSWKNPFNDWKNFIISKFKLLTYDDTVRSLTNRILQKLEVEPDLIRIFTVLPHDWSENDLVTLKGVGSKILKAAGQLLVTKVVGPQVVEVLAPGVSAEPTILGNGTMSAWKWVEALEKLTSAALKHFGTRDTGSPFGRSVGRRK